jgi:DNA repair protein RadC
MSNAFSSSFAPSVLFVEEDSGLHREATPAEVQQVALNHLARTLRGTQMLSSPKDVRDFLCLKLGSLEHELFAILMLDSQHRVIDFVELFRGTVSQTSVYPREVLKEALARNAAAVILVHNHPSGVTEPSRADETMTQNLKSALALVDVRVLDHFIVAGCQVLSFSERGLL